MAAVASNKFGHLADLSSEATVEQFFVNRLLPDLGYRDSQIRPKASLGQLAVHRGRQRIMYRPDYALLVDGQVRWICEVKGVEENLNTWVGQCSSYCLELNKMQKDNPVEYYLLTNGIETRIYKWDSNQCLAYAQFHHFVDGNERYDRIRSILAPDALRRHRPRSDRETEFVHLKRRTVSDLNADFAWAHRTIYKRENLSYTAAFMEFVKLIFLKLISDRNVHASPNAVHDDEQLIVPADEVRFSRRWIEAHEADTPNPLDAISFQWLLEEFETEIHQGNKKRIFDRHERLNLSPDTIKAIVDRFQHSDLISIDADLNGRMFETFLNSTLRGKALGQYFTPRSVVKLATAMARLQASPRHVDRVIDACCGTGGFLIEALSVMWSAIDENSSLTNVQRAELRTKVANSCLIGVDVARDPALARIARINMYLHGDGGSSVYQLDALDKRVRPVSTDTPEVRQEKMELRKLITDAGTGGFADVALTNPPFAKDYNREQVSEGQLLDNYELAFADGEGRRRPLSSLSSMIMFLERYCDLLKPGGRLVTVIDDSLLGASKYRRLRDWLKKRWLIRAVISLPGDAFQRSQARVKTSVLVLEKRSTQNQEQPSVFMYYCTAVGVDDAPRQRILPVDEVNRRRATEEIERVSQLFEAFLDGKPQAAPWITPPENIVDRLDVKACLPRPGRQVDEWRLLGFAIATLGELIEPAYLRGDQAQRADDVIITDESDELVTYLRVRYDGFTEAGEEVWASDVPAPTLHRVRQGDIVLSHINAIHGAVGVVPPEHDGFVVTNEYTVCVAKENIDPRLIWALVRSPEARSDLLLYATGIGRTRITWEMAKKLQLPMPPGDIGKDVVNNLERAEEAERGASEWRTAARTVVEDELRLSSATALEILAAFKPPQ